VFLFGFVGDKKLWSRCVKFYILFGKIWRIVLIKMDNLCQKWGVGVLDMVSLGWFLVKRLCLGFFWVPVLLFFGMFGIVFGVFCRVWESF
jgi:hypothetical protein